MPARLRRRQAGFTLVEQLAALAVVGTVSATALPQLTALDQQARSALLASLAASAGSAMVMNQAGCLLTGGQARPGKCLPLHDCSEVAALLMTDLPAGHVVPAQPLPPDGGRCQVQRVDDGASAAFFGAAAGG